MSISEIVDTEYRLRPADLPDQPLRVTIANVSYQGVEKMSPVLHFEGMTKRLVLSPDLVHRLVTLIGTPIFSQWIGVTVVLSVSRLDDRRTLVVTAAENTPHVHNTMPDEAAAGKRWRIVVAAVGAASIILLLVILFRFAYLGNLLSGLLTN